VNFRIIKAYLAKKAELFHGSEMARLMDRVRQQRMAEFGSEKELRKHVEELEQDTIPVEKLYTKGLTFYEDPVTRSRKLALDISNLTPPTNARELARDLGQRYLGTDLVYDGQSKKLWVGDLLTDEDVVLYLQDGARSGVMSGHDLNAARELAKLIVNLQHNKDKILKEFTALAS